MALKIHHPRPNRPHKQKVIVIQGSCTDSGAITSAKLVDKATNIEVQGQKLTSNMKQWGYLYKGLVAATYKFSITHTSSREATETVEFTAAPGPAPAPGTPPTVTAPATAEEVGVVFYPYGTTGDPITDIQFADATHNRPGTIDQPRDSNGDWAGTVDGIDTWPNGSSNPYQLSVTSTPGTTPTTVNSIKIAP